MDRYKKSHKTYQNAAAYLLPVKQKQAAPATVLVSQAALEADVEADAEAAEERSRLLRENAALRKLANQLYQTLENANGTFVNPELYFAADRLVRAPYYSMYCS